MVKVCPYILHKINNWAINYNLRAKDNKKIQKVYFYNNFQDLNNCFVIIAGNEYCAKLEDKVTKLDLKLAKNHDMPINFQTWPANLHSEFEEKDKVLDYTQAA